MSVAQNGDKQTECGAVTRSLTRTRLVSLHAAQVRANTILHETRGGAYKAVCFVP